MRLMISVPELDNFCLCVPVYKEPCFVQIGYPFQKNIACYTFIQNFILVIGYCMNIFAAFFHQEMVMFLQSNPETLLLLKCC